MSSSPIEATGWPDRARVLSGAGLAVLSMCCVQFGAALSQSATQTLGALHATAWRLVFAAALLSLWRRPALPRLSGGAWRVLLGLGLAMAGMLGSFFAAILTLPQGLAVAINLLGPLLLAWRTDKGPRRGWWPFCRSFPRRKWDGSPGCRLVSSSRRARLPVGAQCRPSGLWI